MRVRANEKGYDGYNHCIREEGDEFDIPDTVTVKGPNGRKVEEPVVADGWLEEIEPLAKGAKAKGGKADGKDDKGTDKSLA